MNRYFDLLRKGIIDFERLMIDQYKPLDLDEVDVILLIRLHRLLQDGQRMLSITLIAPFMSIDEETCSKRIMGLVQKGFISLELSKVDAKEMFSLDGTYKRLSDCLEEELHKTTKQEGRERIQKLIKQLEKELQKMLSPLELELVNTWFLVHKYEDSLLEKALFETLKNRSRGIKFMDRTLYSMKKNQERPLEEEGINIKELFEKVYVKRR